MIRTTIDNWHRHLRGELPGGLDELLHDDCVFWSPVVFAGQRGKALTTMYLQAAYQVFPGDDDPAEAAPIAAGGAGEAPAVGASATSSRCSTATTRCSSSRRAWATPW
ncbi:MAG: hypothetical protein R2695_10800 [Acidimicrobiales bacterium]